MVKGRETLDDQVGLLVLGNQAEYVQNDFPTRPNERSLLSAESSDAHDNVLLDVLLPGVDIVEHDGFKRLQEHLLVAEILSLVLL